MLDGSRLRELEGGFEGLVVGRRQYVGYIV